MKFILFLSAFLVSCTSEPSIQQSTGSFAKLATVLASDQTSGSVSPSKTIDNNPEMENDPFVGTFTVSAYGQTGGALTITHLGGNTYKIDAGTGADNATKHGNILEGVSEGTPFKISIAGNNLIMELSGISVDLIRKSNQASATASGTIDPRLIGKWSRSSAYVSGDASTASQTVLLLLEDGTYQKQHSFTAGGSDWGTGSSSEPVETGTYSVSNLNQEGGILNMDGDQYRYYFANSGGDVLMGWGNGKNPWQKIQ